MRKRFLVLSCVAALSLAAVAGAASADTTITTTVSCLGAYAYTSTIKATVESLPAGFTLPAKHSYTFSTFSGLETCTVSVG